MSAFGEPPHSLDSEPAVPQNRRRDASAVHEVCPFLAVDDGAWRSAYAAREHRCQAVTPPAILAIQKQRQLCLLAAHRTCATFVAAGAVAAAASTPSIGDDGAALWPAVPSAPLVLEPARRMGMLPAPSARSGGQALLVGLMVVAFLVLVIARTQSPAGSAAGTPEASSVLAGDATGSLASASAAPTVAATATPVPEPTVDPASASAASPTGTPAPTAVASRRYKVKSGDTLSSIAAAYGTTVKKIAALNNISDPRYIRVGQVLLIP